MATYVFKLTFMVRFMYYNIKCEVYQVATEEAVLVRHYSNTSEPLVRWVKTLINVQVEVQYMTTMSRLRQALRGYNDAPD